MSLLEVKNLSVDFHTSLGTAKAVRDVSFSVKRDEILGIVGESGSGKSVSAYAVMRLLDPPGADIASGKVLFEGEDLLKKTDKEMCAYRGKEISMVFQEPAMALNPVQKVKKQLREVYKIHMPGRLKEADDQNRALLEKLNIADAGQVMNKYPFELSGGIKQRIMIAMAMISRPKLLIADEPTTALDVTTQAEILRLLKTLQRETHCAMILITHDLGVIAEMADKVMVMYRGQAQEICDSHTFFKKGLHPYSQDLLQARPEFFDGRFRSIPGNIPNAYQVMEGCAYCGRCRFEKEACRCTKIEMKDVSFGHSVRCLQRWEVTGNGE